MANDSDYWPLIDSPAKAVTMMRFGAYTAGLLAVLATGIGGAAIYQGHRVLGMSGWTLIDAAMFAVIAWRMHRLSLPWSIVGLVVFLFERVSGFVLRPHPTFPGIIGAISGTLIFGYCFVHAVRGGLYLQSAKPPSEGKNEEEETGFKQQEHTGYMPAPMPQATQQDDYNEFLQYLRGKNRRFQKPGRSIQDEFKAWSAHRAKHRTAEAKA